MDLYRLGRVLEESQCALCRGTLLAKCWYFKHVQKHGYVLCFECYAKYARDKEEKRNKNRIAVFKKKKKVRRKAAADLLMLIKS